jgi:hypothetical protein
VGAAPLTAQQFDVGPKLGFLMFKEATGLKRSPALGLDAMYHISSRLSIGARFDVSRPSTDGAFFPAEMSFGDTTLIFAVKQPVTLLNFGAQAQVETGGSFSVFATGSAGGYSITLDPQAARGRRSLTEFGFAAGGGLRLRTGGGTSIRLEVQDLVLTNFRRRDLNPVEPRFQPVRFPNALERHDEFDGTAHNLYLSIAFSFTPGGSQ